MRFSISLHPKSKKKGSDSNHADPKNIGREKNRKSQRRISQWLFQNSSSDSDHTKGTQKTMEHRESTQSFSNSSSFNNGSFPYREEIVGSSSSSVSSISEPVVWLESDSESIQVSKLLMVSLCVVVLLLWLAKLTRYLL